MSYRIFILFTGFGLSVIGGVSTIAYLNLLTTGFEFTDYLYYISTNIECLLLPFGILLIWFSIYFPGIGRED
ncbi:hypothetical protein SAMN05877753_108214 [Bacillus oleivorans]|uniref:Uncharacterized protein n=1 Tax=Bacillus oleivorans TaxID=1448271 RepID=A0A285D4D0_9BACI|nr:hypothetical protein [Bacillus oleivorans]SNX74186.1 hypothetical protein SAMN05877753_108214 [Bacillus oleivorans]